MEENEIPKENDAEPEQEYEDWTLIPDNVGDNDEDYEDEDDDFEEIVEPVLMVKEAAQSLITINQPAEPTLPLGKPTAPSITVKKNISFSPRGKLTAEDSVVEYLVTVEPEETGRDTIIRVTKLDDSHIDKSDDHDPIEDQEMMNALNPTDPKLAMGHATKTTPKSSNKRPPVMKRKVQEEELEIERTEDHDFSDVDSELEKIQKKHRKSDGEARRRGVRHITDMEFDLSKPSRVVHVDIDHISPSRRKSMKFEPGMSTASTTTARDTDLKSPPNETSPKMQNTEVIVIEPLQNKDTKSVSNALPSNSKSPKVTSEKCVAEKKDKKPLSVVLRDVKSPGGKQKKMYECPCGMMFSHRSGLSRHRRIVHLGMTYQCKVCGEHFTRSDSLNDHMYRLDHTQKAGSTQHSKSDKRKSFKEFEILPEQAVVKQLRPPKGHVNIVVSEADGVTTMRIKKSVSKSEKSIIVADMMPKEAENSQSETEEKSQKDKEKTQSAQGDSTGVLQKESAKETPIDVSFQVKSLLDGTYNTNTEEKSTNDKGEIMESSDNVNQELSAEEDKNSNANNILKVCPENPTAHSTASQLLLQNPETLPKLAVQATVTSSSTPEHPTAMTKTLLHQAPQVLQTPKLASEILLLNTQQAQDTIQSPNTSAASKASVLDFPKVSPVLKTPATISTHKASPQVVTSNKSPPQKTISNKTTALGGLVSEQPQPVQGSHYTLTGLPQQLQSPTLLTSAVGKTPSAVVPGSQTVFLIRTPEGHLQQALISDPDTSTAQKLQQRSSLQSAVRIANLPNLANQCLVTTTTTPSTPIATNPRSVTSMPLLAAGGNVQGQHLLVNMPGTGLSLPQPSPTTPILLKTLIEAGGLVRVVEASKAFAHPQISGLMSQHQQVSVQSPQSTTGLPTPASSNMANRQIITVENPSTVTNVTNRPIVLNTQPQISAVTSGNQTASLLLKAAAAASGQGGSIRPSPTTINRPIILGGSGHGLLGSNIRTPQRIVLNSPIAAAATQSTPSVAVSQMTTVIMEQPTAAMSTLGTAVSQVLSATPQASAGTSTQQIQLPVVTETSPAVTSPQVVVPAPQANLVETLFQSLVDGTLPNTGTDTLSQLNNSLQ